MTLLVYRIHSLNFLLFWVLSFFFEIVAYEMNPLFGRFKTKRINRLEWDKYFSADEIICLRSDALTAWEKILLRFPLRPWQVSHDGRVVDFSKKAKQEFGACFEHLFLFREIQKKRGAGSKLYIINSREFDYLSGIIEKGLFSYSTRSFISKINIVCDSVRCYFNLAFRIASLSYLTAKASSGTKRPARTLTTPVKYLWDAVNPNEMCLSPEKRTFPWIIDGNNILPEDVVFLIPRVEQSIMSEIETSPYQAFTLFSLYGVIPKAIMRKCFIDLMTRVPALLLSPLLGYEYLSRSDFLCGVLLYKPVILYLKPGCYITNMSCAGNENPVVEYLSVANVRTVMYAYSANAHLAVNLPFHSDFKNIQNANVRSSGFIVWHDQFKKYIEEHPQKGLEVKVIGPLMSGNERVFQDVGSVRKTYVANTTRKGNLKYVSVFDESSAARDWKLKNITHDLFPNLYNDKYCTGFMQDMVRLLDDFDNIVLVFKPQRSMTKKKFSFSREFMEIVEKITNSQRGVILEDDINPWVPISLADLCIGISFTSPVMAAMHYGKPAFFHDPTGIVNNHRYQSISDYITHSYDELNANVKEILFGGERTGNNIDPWFPAKMGFAGSRPGTNSSDEFRKYLSSLSHPDI